jgi:hypothetical protein
MSSQPLRASASSASVNGAPTASDKAYAAVDAAKAKINAYEEGQWGNSWITVFLGLIVCLLILYLVYITEYNNFDTVIAPSSPGVFGNYHGVWLYAAALLAILGASSCFGVMYERNTDAALWTIILIFAHVLLFYFALQNLMDLAKIAFYAWTIIATLVPIVVSVYGIFLARRSLTAAMMTDDELNAMPEGEKKTAAKERNDAIKSHLMACYVMGGVGIIFAIVMGVGLYLLSSNLTLS